MSAFLAAYPWLYLAALSAGVLVLLPLLYRQGREIKETEARIAALDGEAGNVA